MCILFDKPTISGPIAGLATAIDWARDEGAEWLLSIPCDTPFVPADLAERLLFAATAAAAPAAIAQSNGVRHPACGLWSTRLGDALARYLARGRLSLIGFVDSIEGEPITWPTDPFDPFFNVNTRAELAEAEGIAAKFDLTQRLADAS
jgi:molybdopterin-guanine dinucleotide biosynthesis protein A